MPEPWRIDLLLPRRLRDWWEKAGPPGRVRACFVDRHDLRERLREHLVEAPPDLLVVDVFPRGVLGELPDYPFPTRAWLVSRWVRLDYAARPEVLEALERYQVLACELTPWHSHFDLGPVVREPAEPGRGGLRETLVYLGPPSEAGWVHGWSKNRGVTCLGQGVDLLASLSGSQVVISASGYNAYHEIVQSGVPAIFWPQLRGYDQQELRAQGALGSAPRGWSRVVRDSSTLRQALEEWWQCRPPAVGVRALSRLEGWAQRFAGLDEAARSRP